MADLSPVITFRIKLQPDLTGTLHPARHQSDQDNAISEMNAFTSRITTWLPDLVRANHVWVDQDTVVVKGQAAKYIMDTYTTGTRPLLEVVSIA